MMLSEKRNRIIAHVKECAALNLNSDVKSIMPLLDKEYQTEETKKVIYFELRKMYDDHFNKMAQLKHIMISGLNCDFGYNEIVTEKLTLRYRTDDEQEKETKLIDIFKLMMIGKANMKKWILREVCTLLIHHAYGVEYCKQNILNLTGEFKRVKINLHANDYNEESIKLDMLFGNKVYYVRFDNNYIFSNISDYLVYSVQIDLTK